MPEEAHRNLVEHFRSVLHVEFRANPGPTGKEGLMEAYCTEEQVKKFPTIELNINGGNYQIPPSSYIISENG